MLSRNLVYDIPNTKLAPSMKSKNFGLSQKEFDMLVTNLRRNDLAFFEKVFLKQFNGTMKYLQKEYRACNEDAYDATMDGLIEFRKRFVEGKLHYGNLRFLFTRMAVQIFLKNQDNQKSELRQDVAQEEEGAVLEEEIDWLNKAWESLGRSCKELLTWHFYGKMKLSEIALQEERSAASIRKQKERCIKHLKGISKQKSEIG